MQRYAIIGGGLAGVAAAWHLLAASTALHRPIAVHLYDKAGIAGGASGAAAGLLHPLTPKGKVTHSCAALSLLSLVKRARGTVVSS